MALRFNKILRGTRDSDNYSTPIDFYNKLDKEFNFTFDPCPLKCTEFDGLEVEWKGNIFVNPPYSCIEVWLNKGISEIKKGNAKKIVYLIPARVDSWYWHKQILENADEIRLVRGRLKFGEKKDLAPFGVVLVIFSVGLKGKPILKSYEKTNQLKS